MKSILTRRNFLTLSAMGVGAVVVSCGLMGCGSQISEISAPAQFLHGVASGDPTTDAVILWTRVTPTEDLDAEQAVTVDWQVATDANFKHLVNTGRMRTDTQRDYTVKVDVRSLAANQTYYYRFYTNSHSSVVGKTKTLPDVDVQRVKLAVMSCANYPAGYFNVYDLAADETDLDAVLHLGDYIYEGGRGSYASERAAEFGREVLPEGKLLSLSDYRTRYAQYRGDVSLQKLHSRVPFITVWDDHEIANDSWKNGAQAHGEEDGDFEARKLAALQAYFEWLPIRPQRMDDYEDIFRRFQFGNLVDLYMLDTRIVGRDKQLNLADYFEVTTGHFDAAKFTNDINATDRSMLGQRQKLWLQAHLLTSDATWQVLGQQVLMGKMQLPAAIASRQLTVFEYATLANLAQLTQRVRAGDPSLTKEEIAYVQANQHKLTPEILALLLLPVIPYNLDAWDGYADERELIYATAKSKQRNLVVLAGDTHNAWANELRDMQGDLVGVEFATASVSSPGIEQYLNLTPEQYAPTETAITELIRDVKYTNLGNRGFMTVTFTQDKAVAQWHFVNTIFSPKYRHLSERDASVSIKAGDLRIS